MKAKPDEQFNTDSLNKQKKDDEKKTKKPNMLSIFVIPNSSKYKQVLNKREKETKKVMKERETKDNNSTTFGNVKRVPSFPSKGK